MARTTVPTTVMPCPSKCDVIVVCQRLPASLVTLAVALGEDAPVPLVDADALKTVVGATQMACSWGPALAGTTAAAGAQPVVEGGDERGVDELRVGVAEADGEEASHGLVDEEAHFGGIEVHEPVY